MKKFAAIVLALVLCVMFTSAFAAEKMFAMTTVTDIEGNIIATITEEGTAVDANGNDVTDEFPALVLWIDDEAMTCALGNEEEAIEGTVEVTGQTEEGVAMTLTMEDGEVVTAIYTVTGVNACTIVDEANGFLYIMPEIEA